MRKLFSIALLLIALAAAAQEEKAVDLEQLYQQIDEAIEQSPQYVAVREERITKQRRDFLEATDQEQRLMLAEQLFWLFKPYKNDSALYYAQICINLADSVSRPATANRYRALMARQCSNAGMYVEAGVILQQTDKSALDRQGLTDYYDACMHVCGEVAAFSLIPEVRSKYFAEQDHYRDSVLMVADEGSDEYLHLQMSSLVARQQYQEALKVSDKWINKVQEGTHEDAYAAYYRHIVYDKLGNLEMTRFWLAKSALDDIKCAVMDQASLITLAELLNYDGDLDRSYRYIRFTWQCNSFFNTRLRATQISPVLNVIEKNYQDAIDRNTRFLIIGTVVGTLLALLLFVLFYTVLRQKRRLAQAQADLRQKNEELEATNHKLQWMNERVVKNNKQLFEINHRLQEEKNGNM